MERDKMESLLIDYIDGKLNESEIGQVERLLAEDPIAVQLHKQLCEVIGALDASPQLEPSRKLSNNFRKALESEIDASAVKGRQVFFSPVLYRAAAAVVLVIMGTGIGYWIVKREQQASELQALKIEMAATRQAMMVKLDDQQSASQRVMGATAAYNMDKTDDQIVKALVKAMNEDPNTNVRLAALEALGKFSNQAPVRKALLASLATQKDPVVQIELIQLMVRMKEKGVVVDLENIVNDVQTIKAVRDEAYSGLLKLS
jgi:HEAT repeats